MCYNVANLRIPFLIISASVMPRRPAVLLTSPRSIPNSSNLPTSSYTLTLPAHRFRTKTMPIPFPLNHFHTRTQKHPGVTHSVFPTPQFFPTFKPSNLRIFKLAISFRSNTYSRSPCFAVFWPKSSAHNPFRCNTYRLSACNSFIRNTYKKGGGGGYAN